MSRSYCSYDEEWQRRKSVLIRSLFHDIPILSPLEEEFDSSTQVDYAPTDEVFPSPPRPYSPLPPLIIERVPVINKHDEPEEYYQKLHKKIKRMYVKLFIKKLNVNSVGYDSNDDDGFISNDHLTINDSSDTTENLDIPFHQSISAKNGNFNSIVEDRDDSQSSAATESNGYVADCDSMDTVSIDVINNSRSNEDATMISEEEKLASENLDEKKIRNEDNVNKRTNEQNKFSTERVEDLVSGEEPSVGLSTIDDQEMIESGESHEMEVEHSYEDTGPNYKRIDESIKQAHHTFVREQESTHIEDFNESENEKQSEDITEADLDSYNSGSESKETQKTASGSRKEFIEPNDEPFEGEMELEPSSTSEDPDYRQITIQAMVHIDGSQDNGDRESRVYEDSVRSIILPTRFKRVPSRKVDERIRGLAALEEKEDPNTAPIFNSDQEKTTDEDLEEETISLPEAIEQGGEESSSSQIAISEETRGITRVEQEKDASEKAVDERSHQTDFTEKDLVDIETYQSDATSAEMQTQQQNNSEKIIEEITTPKLATVENTLEVTETATPETAEEMITDQPEAANEETRTHQPVTNMEEDGEEPNENMESPHPIEIMRTPRPNLSHGTIPRRYESSSRSTGELAAVPRHATALMSLSQDDVNNYVSEIQTSNDMNEILNSIFNESKDEAPASGRKRKLIDKSVQAVPTSMVSWDEMRANFFVATPKIFRLCACTDHICN